MPRGGKEFLLEKSFITAGSPENTLNQKTRKSTGTFKDHLISVLATVHPNLPLHLRCRLIPLAVTTLNLLRPSQLNPKLFAYEILKGTFSYNKTLIAPPRKKVLGYDLKWTFRS